MVEPKRFDILQENHIGFGIRWRKDETYRLELSVAFPFFTIVFGFGERL